MAGEKEPHSGCHSLLLSSSRSSSSCSPSSRSFLHDLHALLHLALLHLALLLHVILLRALLRHARHRVLLLHVLHHDC